MNKSSQLPSNAGYLTDGDMGFNGTLRIEPKRDHHLFMDDSEPELFSYKRKAVDFFNWPISDSSMNVSPWENTSSLQAVSGNFDRLSGSEPVRTINTFDMNTPSLGIGSDDQFENGLSIGLSMPYQTVVPLSAFNPFGFKKFKFNEVCDPNTSIPATMGHSFSKGDNNTISIDPFYNKNNNNATLLANHKDENTISVGPIFNKPGENSTSQGHLSNKRKGTFKLMGHSINMGDEGIESMGQCFSKGNGNFISMGQPSGKKDRNVVSMDCNFDKEHENVILMDSNYNSVNEKLVSFGSSSDKADKSFSRKVDEHIRLMGPTYGKVNSGIASKCTICENCPSMGQNCNKGEKGTVSSGGFIDEPEVNSSEKIITSNNVPNQSSAQALEIVGQKDSVEANAGPIVKCIPKADSKTNASARNKKPKPSKPVPEHNFPANVKILLSTGIFDGVPVKYVSWKRDKTLRGVIEGGGYMCSCKECNHTKSLNAFEFESHAGFSSKHPNKNIYFANGKSIYLVAQELKYTPLEKLFEAIENITNSPINQRNFRIWKESFRAANRELQRIYGKDEVIISSENKDLASSKV